MATVEQHEFKPPERVIKREEDMGRWLKSEAYANFVGWIKILSDSVKGKKISDPVPESPAIGRLVAMLDKLSAWVDEIEPVKQPQRFGNVAFRKWLDKVKPNATQLISDVLPDNLKGAVVELETYFLQGFGNYTRIDYGTGHEAKFMAFLCCLMRIGAVPTEDSAAVVLRVNTKYLDLVRKLQKTYTMEPAGSHGVWGLDDFQFIPFIWGAAQLIGHEQSLPPAVIPDANIAEKNQHDFIFMSCLHYINQVKTGPFAEHSNTLWGISGLSDWNRVHSGLTKMFEGEILKKFPVIQHFPVGTILSIEPDRK